jgi:hypothetical protein
MSESFVAMKLFMILRLPTEDGNADLRHAAMDCRPDSQDAPETSMSGWIPALHAGMTQSKVVLKVTEAPPTRIFKGGLEAHGTANLGTVCGFVVNFSVV